MFKIEKVKIFHVKMPLISPFNTAYGSDEVIHTVLVQITSGDLYGWGESCPLQLPTYSPEWAAGIFMVLRDVLVPLVLGKQILSGQNLQNKLSSVKGNQFAKAALDLAWWDLYAKSQNQPLWKIINGSSNIIEVGADFGVMENLDLLLDAIDTAVKDGFKRIKLKYRPGWDLQMVAAVRRAFPNTVFHIDCNSAFTLNDLPMFEQLDRYNLAMIEQPLSYDDLIDHAELQKRINTPICLDESITSPNKARKAIQIGACRWINLKPGRVGGLTNVLEIHNICRAAGIPCWVGSMLESGLGASFLKALSTLPNIKYPCDIFPSRRFYKKDLATPEICLSGPGKMTVSTAAGVGPEPDPQELQQSTIQKVILKC